jgi:hypothetical protein
MDRLRWIGDLLANSFPELKPVVHSYPIQLRPAVGDDELHRACLHEFSNETLVKVPNASVVQRTLLVPEFSERQFRDYSLVGFQSVCLPSIVQNLSRFGSSAWFVGKSERLVLDPGDHQSPGSVAQIPLRSREELFEQFF